ncbi:active breakpoint cluster region-related protein isoform X2 [Helicoverpa zea]|uniref:active breakpoint cluster region-related protein isoform X2 n=1 Tax=Helicoverpa zea TaxID=7113 RepID=UPI001F56D677|nr:active breakpoint cluster region-related protein isoform X2 [Helicoverpa zea]
MSVFGDFQRVWVQRFPESALPAAWEEDVRANLAKHKQKVAILREELEKEEFYVEYLETLLSDVEKHKAVAQGNRTAPPSGGDVNDLDDKASDSKQESNSDSLKKSEVSLNSNKSEDSTPETAECEPVQLRNKPVRVTERSSVNQCINELSNLAAEAARRRCNSEIVQRTDINQDTNAVEQTSPNQAKNRPTSQTGDFVTVIEVNGLKLAASKKSEESQQSSEGSPVDPVAIAKKKVPPKPPPKVFSKRGASLPETGLAEDSPPSSLGRRIRNAESRESIASRASTPSISERVKSYESINSLSSERKRSGGAATPRSIDEEATSTTPDLGEGTDADKSAPLSLESIPAAVPGSEDEPYYDQVPVDINDGEYVYIQAGGTGSSTEDGSSGASTLPLGASAPSGPTAPAPPTAPRAPDSPPCATAPNYVNIHYFIQKGGDGTEGNETVSDLADSSDTPLLLRTISSDTEASATPPALRKLHTQESSSNNAEAERLTMHRCIITSIIESETVYVECLYVMEKYMNAIKATLSTSQPVITEEEFNTIFYKISELHELHKNFLEGLKAAVASWEEPLSVGIHFKKMAENINIYGAFLHNYGRATDAVRRRCSSSQSFAHLTRQISCHGQPMSLDDLLHKPVARVQKNALVLHDLIKYTPASHPDHAMLTEALNMTQHFLDEFNIIQTKSMFPNADRAQRRLVKNSFIVELSDGHRKLRHLFLFNDVIACAKYKVTTASGRDKFTFELKWFIPLPDIVVVEDESVGANANDARETSPANIVALKSQASTVRDQILAEERAAADDKKIRIGGRGAAERQRKKLAELEAALVLASPNLTFRVGARAPGSASALQRQHIFFLSSEYERTQWIDSIHALQASSAPPAGSSAISMLELQAWVTACRSYLQTDMGSYLLRSGRDDSLLLGDLQLHVGGMTAPLDTAADYYIVVEVDSYGHYFRKAKSKLVCRSAQPRWNESFTLDLEGSQNLRLLLYEDAARPVLRGKCTIKLSREWVAESAGGGVGRTVCVGGGSLTLRLRLLPPERSARRVPAAKPGALFGNKITHVAKREKRNIPFIISACVREVERRGIHEVGIYRVSGSASDLNRLKKSFETNAYEAEQLLKEVDIHSVTGVLKLYLRELPEALFTDALYPELLKAWGATQGAGTSVDSGPAHTRRHALLKCYAQLPDLNKNCIDFLLNHFVKVNQHEGENKMSLHNLATVFGPTLLRPGSAGAGSKQRTDLLAAGTVDAMAQAGILYCLLQQRQLAAQLSSHHRAPHSLLD